MTSVCYVLADYPVLSQTFVHADLVALRKQGIEVGVVAHRRGDPRIRFGGGTDGEPFELLHVGLDQPGLDSVLARFDHLHCHFADLGVRVLGPIAERLGLPYSFTAHAYDLFRRGSAVQPHEWQALSTQCRRVVTVSRFHRDFICSRGVAPGRVALIPHAARLGDLLARNVAPPTQLRRILAVGRPTAKKGFGILIQAWARAREVYPDLTLEIIGGERLMVELGMTRPPSGLQLTPMRPYAEVIDAMAAADLLVAPCVVAPNGDMDGIPTVLAEAGALRRPVIASALSGIPDMVAHGVNGLLVPPGDIAALAGALIRLRERPDELTRMGQGGPQMAVCHDADIVAARLVREAFAA